MNRIEIILFKGHFVDVAVPFWGDSTRLFWQSGIVTSVDDSSLILKNGDRLRRISFTDIRDIHLSSRSI